MSFDCLKNVFNACVSNNLCQQVQLQARERGKSEPLAPHNHLLQVGRACQTGKAVNLAEGKPWFETSASSRSYPIKENFIEVNTDRNQQSRSKGCRLSTLIFFSATPAAKSYIIPCNNCDFVSTDKRGSHVVRAAHGLYIQAPWIGRFGFLTKHGANFISRDNRLPTILLCNLIFLSKELTLLLLRVTKNSDFKIILM